MKRTGILPIAALAFAGLWIHVRAQVTDHPPTVAPAPNKSTPADVAAPKSNPGPPFAVVETKRREIPGDLAIAAALGIRPVRITSPAAIAELAPAGQAFKWVLTIEGELWALPMLDRHLVFTEKDRDIIKHDIVTRGAAVMSAGKAVVRGGVLFIDPRSGHYRPSLESVRTLAAPAFREAGFATVEVSDNLLSD
jgi:hypothetical protein